jgi:ribose 5-phosphate isomerase B
MNTLYIASDHAGVDLKAHLQTTALFANFKVIDLGPNSTDSVDYPDFAHPLAEKVGADENALGVLICGSGNGVCMTANKHKNIRAGLAWTDEIASLTKQHNNANVICIPARFVSESEAETIVKAFLETDFEGGRHQRRVSKI